MKLAHKTKANKDIVEAAERVHKSGCSIDWDSAFSTVSIDHPDEESIFMQGQEADEFIGEIRVLCKRYPSLDDDTAALALSEPYIECLWS